MYFVDPYGKTKAQEDRARVMQYVMYENAYSEEMMKHPVLKAKLQVLSNAIREAFDTSGWDAVHWERFF